MSAPSNAGTFHPVSSGCTSYIIDPGDVRPLGAHGIVALSCRDVEGDRLRFAALSPTDMRLANGRTRPSYDIMLRPADARILTRR